MIERFSNRTRIPMDRTLDEESFPQAVQESGRGLARSPFVRPSEVVNAFAAAGGSPFPYSYSFTKEVPQ